MIIQRRRILILSYDLNAANHNYTEFYEMLKAQGTWWHYLANTWLLATSKTPKQVFAALAPHILQEDRLLIATLAPGDYYGWLPKQAWDWINEQTSSAASVAVPPQVSAPPGGWRR